MIAQPVWLLPLVKAIEGMGYEFVGYEQSGSLLRLYIDKASGVTVEDCAKVSAQAKATLLVEAPQREYRLEVSSPGLERPLFQVAHYIKYVGSRVKVKLNTLISEQKRVEGVIDHVVEETIYIQRDDSDTLFAIPFASIEKAHLVFDLNRKVGV